MIPPALLASVWQGRWKFYWRSLFRISAWLGAGLLVYLLLPIWALSNPPVNWGNPVTFRQFVWLVTGEFYQRNFQVITSAGLLERIQAWATLLLQQFEIPGLLLALVGLIYYFKPSRLYFITLWNAIFFSCFAILYGSFDSYVYFLPVFLSFVLWVGLGIGGLLQRAGKHTRGLQIATLVIFFLSVLCSDDYSLAESGFGP